MKRRWYIVLLLFLSWVVVNIHRIWNNTDPVETYPFPLDEDYPVSWHWYIHTILKDISYLLIMMAAWLYIRSNLKRDKAVTTAFGAIFVVTISDSPHYILAARHSEVVLALQGAFLLYAALKIIINAKNQYHGKGG